MLQNTTLLSKQILLYEVIHSHFITQKKCSVWIMQKVDFLPLKINYLLIEVMLC